MVSLIYSVVHGVKYVFGVIYITFLFCCCTGNVVYRVGVLDVDTVDDCLLQGVCLDNYIIPRRIALHIAIMGGDVDRVNMLLYSDSDVTAGDVGNMSVMHIAVITGDLGLVRVLIVNDPDLVNLFDDNGHTPLHYACMFGNVDIARLLIDGGASLSALDICSFTPMHCAAIEGYFGVIGLLKDRGASLDAKCYTGMTPLDYYCMNRNL